MSDERQIEEVLARYLRAADHRDPTTMAELFTDDAVVKIFYSGNGRHELIGELRGSLAIGDAVATGMSPHPPLGWSHHTTLNPIITVDADTATYDGQFIVYTVVGQERPSGGWPSGATGAQGTITPIESGYVLSTLRRVGHAWKLAEHIIKHDLPYAFPG